MGAPLSHHEIHNTESTPAEKCVMAVINSGIGEVPDGPPYKWTVQDTVGPGCRVTVAIGGWELTRPFPAMLTSAEAKTAADKIAADLLVIIKSAK